MMELMKSFGQEKMPSVINDPFAKTHITGISVRWYNNSLKARGNVDFENGSTKGSQEFSGETFDEVVLKIKAMLETL